MHKKLIQTLSWNSSTIFLYKTMLLSHQILLYSVMCKTSYGMQSSLFAMIYTLIAFTNFGFDETLLPFFATFMKNQRSFLQLLWQLLMHAITLLCITIMLYIIILYNFQGFLHNINIHCNENLIFIICSIFFIENIKKTALAIMQLAFLQQQIAYAQISMLYLYITIIWIFYAIYHEITTMMIFAPMLAISALEFTYCSYVIQKLYKKLPQKTETDAIPFQVFLKQRVFNYINQISKTIYSANSITLFFVYILGLQQAATIKFYTNLITLCYTCIAKTVGLSTGAIFSSMNQDKKLYGYFNDVTQRYFQFLSIVTTICIGIVGYAWLIQYITTTMALHILLFFMITLFEQLTITYEQLYITQGQAVKLAIINSISLGIIIPSSYAYTHDMIYQSVFIFIIIVIKVISLMAITRLYQYK